MRQPAAPVSAAAVPTGRWYRVATPLQDSSPHRRPVTLWLEVNLFVRRGLHGCDQGGAGIGTGCLLFGESIERFRKKLVNIVKTTALDSVQHAPFKLGLVDFDVHCRPPIHHYGSMPQSARESGLGAPLSPSIRPHPVRWPQCQPEDQSSEIPPKCYVSASGFSGHRRSE